MDDVVKCYQCNGDMLPTGIYCDSGTGKAYKKYTCEKCKAHHIGDQTGVSKSKTNIDNYIFAGAIIFVIIVVLRFLITRLV